MNVSSRSSVRSASTKTSWSRAWRADCACRTARRTASPGSRSRRRAAASPRCARSSSTARRSTTRSATRWRRACSAAGCEAACPSAVPFGHLMEGPDRRCTHADAAADPRRRRAGRARGAEWLAYVVVLPRHWLLLALTWVAWLGAAPAPRPAPVRAAAAVARVAAHAARRPTPASRRVLASPAA